MFQKDRKEFIAEGNVMEFVDGNVLGREDGTGQHVACALVSFSNNFQVHWHKTYFKQNVLLK